MDGREMLWVNVLGGMVAVAILLLWPSWRIFRRAGLPPAWALVVLLPYVGILVALFLLAFTRWPADPQPREIER